MPKMHMHSKEMHLREKHCKYYIQDCLLGEDQAILKNGMFAQRVTHEFDVT